MMLLALLLAVASPEIELKAVTTSAGIRHPKRLLNNAMRTLQLLGQNPDPVAGKPDATSQRIGNSRQCSW